MKELIYEELIDIELKNALEIIENSSNKEDICKAILAMGANSNKTNESKYFLYSCFKINNLDISRAAVVAIGHMARINKNVYRNEFLAEVEYLKFKNVLLGVIEDVLDDIEIFVDN